MKALVVMALCAAGCLSSKEPSYYALTAKTAEGASGGAPKLVELRRPGMAGYLDRADVVQRVKNNQLSIDSSERWAEPLGDMVGRVLAQDLASRLPGTQLFVESGAVSAIPEVVVAVDVQQFDRGADGNIALVAQVVLEAPGTQQAARAKQFALSGQPSDGSVNAQAATMSELVAQLADKIATMLRETPPPLPQAAPTHG